jgi:hypothetical protein
LKVKKTNKTLSKIKRESTDNNNMPQFSLLNNHDPYAVEKLIIRASFITEFEIL